MLSHHIHKIVKIYTETKSKGKDINSSTNVIDVFRNAEQNKEIYRYNETTYFCCYKTNFEEKPAILLLFAMNLPGPTSGSSTASDYVMGILSMLEKQFTPLDDTYFTKEIDSSKKNIGFLRVIKIIREDDLL